MSLHHETYTNLISPTLQLLGSKPGVSTQMKFWALPDDIEILCVVCVSVMYF